MGKRRARKRGETLDIQALLNSESDAPKIPTAEAEKQEGSDNLRKRVYNPSFDFCGEPVPEDDARRSRILEMVFKSLSPGTITRSDVICTIKTAINIEDAEHKKQTVGDFLSKYSQKLSLCDIGSVEEELIDRKLISRELGVIEYCGMLHLVGVSNEGVDPVERFVREFVVGLLPKTGTPTYTSIVDHIVHMCAFH